MEAPLDLTQPLPVGFQFTQSKLQDMEDCPRRFYLKHILNQPWPSPFAEPQAEIEKAMQRGTKFHALVERHQLGISFEKLYQSVGDDTQLQQWLEHYQAYMSGITGRVRHWVEILLSTSIKDYPLVAKYDFMMLLKNQEHYEVRAIDWKTSKLPSRERLAKRMQTMVYLLVLYRQAAYLTEIEAIQRFSLCYVSVVDNTEIEFTVDGITVIDLEHKIEKIVEQIPHNAFDKTENERFCHYCVYRGLCERGTSRYIDEIDAIDWENIVDIGLQSIADDALEF